jgi:uncharacterized protein YcfJ
MVQVFKFLVFSIAVCGLISGCSSLGKSTTAGAGVGATAGGLIGNMVPGDDSSRPSHIIIGAATGAAIGALSGALIHKSMEESERDGFDKGKTEAAKNFGRGTLASSGTGSGNRRYVPPKIERRYIEDEIRGNVLVEAHYEQVIVEEGHWE